ncbi:hypothetical protein SAMN04488531_1627 [Corynebacterium coyleae]|uniref:Beta-N-acetylglucosaminidase n=1 Tax=Corynebacterium coyleae TaxID=53374 RepID=A0ABX8KV98_9CORY|nr:hypothetical protein [Corynebacterium coyleae]QXB17813.1 hypothetical protein I6L55_07790 [Corynebacterium coyleae]WJY79232.1 hypothetical protein CCOY_03040 [Corynebacterium coyleae]SEB71838.1 hypothetical protein SAMN04488531_1627 [Corynebacterium coyleae]
MSVSRRAIASAVLVGSLSLAACGGGDNDEANATSSPISTSYISEDPTTSSDSETTTPETTTSVTTTIAASESGTASESESASETVSSTSTSSTKREKAGSSAEATLEKVRERFASLAPEEFFDQFEGCGAGGISGSYDCQGDEIGQFQFFDSESKAASSTQLLTELRSSRVVEDSGDRVVGWSTLGTSAIITVVDNREGLVMQQLISSDQEDPRQRIYDLGLAKKP